MKVLEHPRIAFIQCPWSSVLSRVLAPVSWLLCAGSSVLAPLSWVLCPGSSILAPQSWVLSWLLCPGSPVLAPLFWLLHSGSSVLVHLSWLPCPGSSVMGPLSWVLCPGSSGLGSQLLDFLHLTCATYLQIRYLTIIINKYFVHSFYQPCTQCTNNTYNNTIFCIKILAIQGVLKTVQPQRIT